MQEENTNVSQQVPDNSPEVPVTNEVGGANASQSVQGNSPQVDAVHQEAAKVVENRPSSNPLMARFNKMPPETFRIPSAGVTYHNGELDPEVVNGEVLVYPMTTVDEITMRSPDMLYQGSAIESVFKRCIPQVNKPLELLSNDVDYLLICLRMVTYGNILEIYWDCPKCGNDKEILPDDSEEEHRVEQRHDGEKKSKELLNVRPTYDLNLNEFLRKTVPFNPNSPEYSFTLHTGEHVKLRPSTIAEMIKLYQYDLEKIETPQEMADFIVDNLMSVIESVNGISDREQIREWGLACEAPVITELQDKIHVANDWGTSQKYDFECKKCGYSSETVIPMNPIHFFTAPSIKQTKP